MAYPPLSTALAAERIADLRREAARRRTMRAALRARRGRISDLRREVARRCIVRAALRALRTRRAAASEPLPAIQTSQPPAAGDRATEHLYDEESLAIADGRITRSEIG
jgi:hypothetical protein